METSGSVGLTEIEAIRPLGEAHPNIGLLGAVLYSYDEVARRVENTFDGRPIRVVSCFRKYWRWSRYFLGEWNVRVTYIRLVHED